MLAISGLIGEDINLTIGITLIYTFDLVRDYT